MSRHAIDITVDKTRDGLWLLTTIHRGQFYKQRYGGYTLVEAKQRFRAYIKEQQHSERLK